MSRSLLVDERREAGQTHRSLRVIGSCRGRCPAAGPDARAPAWCNDRVVSTPAVLAYLAAAILIAWGIAHLMPTRAVAASFGAISLDNRRILVMKWAAEGITHISLGALVLLATAIEGTASAATQLIYGVAAVVLIVLAALTAATGSRTPVNLVSRLPVRAERFGRAAARRQPAMSRQACGRG